MTRLQSVMGGLACVAVVGGLIAGCGGGSSSSPAATAASPQAKSAVNVYVTDSFADQYSQVDVSVYGITVSTDGTNYTSVYSNTSGMTVDVASLANVASLIGSATLANGTYKSAKITIGDTITVVPKSGSTSSSYTVDLSTTGASAGSSTTTVLTIPFNATVSTNAQNQVVIDFNLTNFKIVNGKIQPSCGQASTSSVATKTFRVDLGGTVAGLVSGKSFNLTIGGTTIPVTVTSTTSIFSSADGSDTTLANGGNVVVQGTYDPTTKTITATDIRVIEPITTVPIVAAYGTVSNVTSTGFTLTIITADLFTPTAATVAVSTATSTKYHVPLSNSASSSSVTPGETGIVTGSFNTTTQTLTANRVDLFPTSAQ